MSSPRSSATARPLLLLLLLLAACAALCRGKGLAAPGAESRELPPGERGRAKGVGAGDSRSRGPRGDWGRGAGLGRALGDLTLGSGAGGVPGQPWLHLWEPAGAEFLSPSPGAPMTGELRCQCLETTSEVIRPKSVVQVELIPEGPHCEVAEVIATTKHGKKVCLDPTAPWVKLIINKILNRYLHWGWD
uniref:C-X-C motif chemokine n=1 Tax=Pelusios castaneus TaxID=367368 RepID=A0A8C8SAA5_9SAUR